ncbi:MAG: hypothetical protein HZY75_14350 [Nocardioidaceae bacterium]|nr:MAG: hypothetical protein HZY75_14350 [Nocardioidaceae bacterium]
MPDGPPGALALTDDGFVTRGIVTPDGEMLSHLGEDWFVFGNAGEPNASLTTLDLTLVRTDGTMKQVRGTKDPGPIRPGEFFYTYTFGDGPITALAIDPDSGVAREAEVPELYSGITTGAEGRAWGTAANWYVHEPAFYYRSEDGGATWSSTQLANQGLWVYDAPRALGDPSLPVAVLEYARNDGQDNLAAVHRSTDDGRTFERIPLFVDNEGKSFGASGRCFPTVAWSSMSPSGSAAPSRRACSSAMATTGPSSAIFRAAPPGRSVSSPPRTRFWCWHGPMSRRARPPTAV